MERGSSCMGYGSTDRGRAGIEEPSPDGVMPFPMPYMIQGVIKTIDLLKNLTLVCWLYPLKIVKILIYMVDGKKHTFLDIHKED